MFVLRGCDCNTMSERWAGMPLHLRVAAPPPLGRLVLLFTVRTGGANAGVELFVNSPITAEGHEDRPRAAETAEVNASHLVEIASLGAPGCDADRPEDSRTAEDRQARQRRFISFSMIFSPCRAPPGSRLHPQPPFNRRGGPASWFSTHSSQPATQFSHASIRYLQGARTEPLSAYWAVVGLTFTAAVV